MRIKEQETRLNLHEHDDDDDDSRLGSSFSCRTGMSSLGCVINFSRYLVLWLVISALTVGICRSVCMTVFGTYRGAT